MPHMIPFNIVPTVRILVVADTRPAGQAAGGFNFAQTMSAFDLEMALNAVKAAPLPWVRFEIVTAHRDTTGSSSPEGAAAAGTAQHPGFRFDALPAGLSLATIDQIWLFGFAAAQDTGAQPTPALSAAELTVLHSFMDSGGGVFATGDHESIGSFLCSGVKRVKDMRTWDRRIAGAPQPPLFGPTRHDTTRESPPGSSYYAFNNQSDRYPQPIRLRRYRLGYIPSELIFPKVRDRPHPLLCGLKGPIDVLPDHMHEGEVLVPSGIGAGNADWPGTTRAEIVAWADVIAHSDVQFGAVNGTSFGAVGAYDGHAEGVGRVAVDSTWHHWVHINLVGFATTPTQTGNPEALSRIYNYFRNVAVWLASPAMQSAMSEAAWLLAFLSGGLTEIGPLQTLDTPYTGQQAIDALGRYASLCNIEYFVFQRPDIPRQLQPPGWHGPDPGPWYRWPMMDYCAGAQVKAVAARFAKGQMGEKVTPELRQRHLNDAVTRGLMEMIERESPAVKASLAAMEQLRERLAAR